MSDELNGIESEPSLGAVAHATAQHFSTSPSQFIARAVQLIGPIAIFLVMGLRINGQLPFWLVATSAALLLPVTIPFNLYLARGLDEPSASVGVSRDAAAPASKPTRLISLSVGVFASSYVSVFGYYALLHWAATSFPPALQVPVFSMCALMTIPMAVLFTTDRGRVLALIFSSQYGGGLAWMTSLTSNLVSATTVFGCATFASYHHHLITFTASGSPTVDQFIRFYFWQFLNSVPVLNVTETIRWAAPMGYTHSSVGCLVLAYKLVAITPIIAAFIAFYKSARVTQEQKAALWGLRDGQHADPSGKESPNERQSGTTD